MSRFQIARSLLLKELARAQAASDRASEARFNVPSGGSRARVTTANARWMRAAEARDRIQRELDDLVQRELDDLAGALGEPGPCAKCGRSCDGTVTRRECAQCFASR